MPLTTDLDPALRPAAVRCMVCLNLDEFVNHMLPYVVSRLAKREEYDPLATYVGAVQVKGSGWASGLLTRSSSATVSFFSFLLG